MSAVNLLVGLARSGARALRPMEELPRTAATARVAAMAMARDIALAGSERLGTALALAGGMLHGMPVVGAGLLVGLAGSCDRVDGEGAGA